MTEVLATKPEETLASLDEQHDVAARNSPGTVYESGRRRREEILEAATALFGEYAYNGVSMRDVAAATGVTHAGLRYHFPSKDDLLLAVLERLSDLGDEYYERALECMNQTPPNFWGVLGEFTAYLRFTLVQPLRAQMFIMHAILAADPGHPAHGYFERRYRLIRDQYTEIIGLLCAHGYMNADIDAGKAAAEIIAVSDGLQLQWLIRPHETEYRPIIEGAIRRLVRPEHHAKYDEVIAGLELPGGA